MDKKNILKYGFVLVYLLIGMTIVFSAIFSAHNI
jgi:hypothetical protein